MSGIVVGFDGSDEAYDALSLAERVRAPCPVVIVPRSAALREGGVVGAHEAKSGP